MKIVMFGLALNCDIVFNVMRPDLGKCYLDWDLHLKWLGEYT